MLSCAEAPVRHLLKCESESGDACLQGGFIWDWMDQGLLKMVTTVEGEVVEAWAYGGDFGDTPHDGQFCINGLIWPNHLPHPAAWEVKHVQVSLPLECVSYHDALRIDWFGESLQIIQLFATCCELRNCRRLLFV